jgi:hypothetical protein
MKALSSSPVLRHVQPIFEIGRRGLEKRFPVDVVAKERTATDAPATPKVLARLARRRLVLVHPQKP